jgi:predicted Fe-Mo cluster-binding NifX family protein
MKIALPSRGNLVDSHFGHCEYFTIFTVDDNSKQILSQENHSVGRRLRLQIKYRQTRCPKWV